MSDTDTQPKVEQNLHDELVKVIVAVQPNIKYRDLERMVANFLVEFPRLAELQEREDA